MPKISEMNSFVVDLDGVLWRGPEMLPGVAEFFDHIHHSGTKLLLASNNSTARPAAVQRRLEAIGVHVPESSILTSALATAAYLSKTLPAEASVLAIGEDGLRHALTQSGFHLVETADDVRAVVVGLDRDVTYARLAEATLAIRHGAIFVGTNPDRTFPTERGLVPGNGSLLAAVQAATDQDPIIIGKPEKIYFELALEKLKSEPGGTVMLGDRIDTDILGGQNAGLNTCLVMTGVDDRKTLERSQIQPTWVFTDLVELTAALREESHA